MRKGVKKEILEELAEPTSAEPTSAEATSAEPASAPSVTTPSVVPKCIDYAVGTNIIHNNIKYKVENCWENGMQVKALADHSTTTLFPPYNFRKLWWLGGKSRRRKTRRAKSRRARSYLRN
jgi:hypothetical protein